MAFRRRTRWRRRSNRALLAKARNARFERRVEAIAKRHIETKAIKWANAIVFPAGYSAPSWVWVVNPFFFLGSAGDQVEAPSTDRLIGDEFILRGLKLEWNVSTNELPVKRLRISLVSTDYRAVDATTFEGDFAPLAGTMGNLFLDADETSTDPTFRRFNDRSVNVLRTKEFKLQTMVEGGSDDHQGKIYWATDQKKTRADQQEVNTGEDRVDFLKNRQYYWVVEMFQPGITFQSSWESPNFYQRWQFTVYYKDA